MRHTRVGRILGKLHEANKVMTHLAGKNGIWASSVRYRHQCWTRDSCLAVFWPFLHFPPLQAQQRLVTQQLITLADKQSPEGRIPIVFADDPQNLERHLCQLEADQKRTPYALSQLRKGKFEYITEHTRDSETLFIATTLTHLRSFDSYGEPVREKMRAAAFKALDYIIHKIPKDAGNGLILGGDWRDTSVELEDKPVLSNAVLLYRAYKAAHHFTPMASVLKVIQEQYWDEKNGYFCNYPSSCTINRKGFLPVFEGQTMVQPGGCDRLGNALCILEDIATPQQSERILEYLIHHSRTSVGIDIGGVYLSPKTDDEKQMILRDRTVFWPWIHNFVTLALHHHLERYKLLSQFSDKTLEELMDQSTAIHGFPEWCDIRHGYGCGSPGQTWSAATYIRLCQTLYPRLTHAYSFVPKFVF